MEKKICIVIFNDGTYDEHNRITQGALLFAMQQIQGEINQTEFRGRPSLDVKNIPDQDNGRPEVPQGPEDEVKKQLEELYG